MMAVGLLRSCLTLLPPVLSRECQDLNPNAGNTCSPCVAAADVEYRRLQSELQDGNGKPCDRAQLLGIPPPAHAIVQEGFAK
mmetsp:Transcript_7463/g.13000  ORF Transcript_7463/g.13000 Transcript_7463/m.13000 type:complete len:82 (-) Transcript_7463:788-1033(-)